MNNITLFVLGFLILNSACHAQYTNTDNYGLSRNKNVNNTMAFKRLSNSIHGKKNITIDIAKGEYKVGAQQTSTKISGRGTDILVIENCENITVKGNNSILKHRDGLYYGAFNPLTKTRLPKITKNRSLGAFIGNSILIKNSKNVIVQDFVLDGNIENQVIGGSFGDKGIQLIHCGIRILNSSNVTIKNCTTKYFGLDGFYILNSLRSGKNTPNQNIKIINCLSEYNGRQGMSWVSGRGLTVTNSSFNHTAQSVVRSQPMSGLDIEPNKNSYCMDGTFDNCSFINNASTGFVSDYNGHKEVVNINFNNCLFFASEGSAIFPKNGNIVINNSKIYGPVIAPGGPSPSNRLVIKNSIFKDTSFNGKKSKYFPMMIDAGGKRKNYTIDNCSFYMKSFMPCYLVSGSTKDNELPIISNNKFYLRYKKLPRTFFALFRGCILKNNTFYDQMDKSIKGGMYINSKTAAAGTQTMIYRGYNKIISSRKNIGWLSHKGVKNMPAREIRATR